MERRARRVLRVFLLPMVFLAPLVPLVCQAIPALEAILALLDPKELKALGANLGLLVPLVNRALLVLLAPLAVRAGLVLLARLVPKVLVARRACGVTMETWAGQATQVSLVTRVTLVHLDSRARLAAPAHPVLKAPLVLGVL